MSLAVVCGVCSQQVIEEIERLENGLTKLRSTTEEVALLEERLKESKVVVEEKREQADALMSRVGAEKVPLRLVPTTLLDGERGEWEETSERTGDAFSE